MTSFCFSDISSAFSHRFISQSSLSRVFCFIFNDLLTKSYSPKNNQISRLSFIEYFDLPLLVMERIYKVLFDNKQSISLKVFEDKMKIFTSFNLKEISKFCFQIYDFDNNGNITGNDINLIYRSIIRYIKYNKGFDDTLRKYPKDDKAFKVLPSYTYEHFDNEIRHINSDMFMILFYILNKISDTIYSLVEELNEDSDINSTSFTKEDDSLCIGNLNIFPINTNIKETIHAKEKSKHNMTLNRKVKFEDSCILDKLKINEYKVLNNINLNKHGKNLIRDSFISINAKTPLRVSTKKISLPSFTQENKSPAYYINQPLSKFKLYNRLKAIQKKPNLQLDSISLVSNLSLNKSISPIKNSHPSTTKENKKISFNNSHSRSITTRVSSIINEERELLLFSLGTFTKYTFIIKNNFILYYEVTSHKLKGIINLHKISFKHNEFANKNLFSVTLYHNVSSSHLYFETEETYNYFSEKISSITESYNNSDIIKRYKVSKIIGQGKYSIIYKARRVSNENEKQYAMKILRKLKLNKVDYEAMRREIEVMQMLDEEDNVAKFIETGESFEYVYIIMEYVPSVDLKTYYTKNKSDFTLETIQTLSKQLLEIVNSLHNKCIIHRDIKADNIIYNQDTKQITLIDFGLSRIIGNGEHIYNESFGTLGYAAPEIIQGDAYDNSVDTFSIGVLIYYLIYGIFPFDSKEDEAIYQNTLDCDVNYYEKEGKEIKFLQSILIKNRRKRSTIQMLLCNSWITGS